jgi:hypothetical protein
MLKCAGVVVALMGTVVVGDPAYAEDHRKEYELSNVLGLRIYAVADKRPDGPAAAVNFTIDATKGVQILAKRQLSSVDEAAALAQGAQLDLCGSNGTRTVFRVKMGNLASYYYAAEPQQHRWGEYSRTLTGCPKLDADPVTWNPALQKAPGRQ